MQKNPDQPADAAELRRRAEERLQARERASPSAIRHSQLELETARLVHELQVHQIELEMQNEELKASQGKVRAGLALYADLYDFAPTGYLTFDPEGTVRLANLTGACLLGLERSRLVKRRFGQFVAENDRRTFSDFLQRVFASEAKVSCEVALLRGGLQPLVVQIEGTRSADGQECRAVVLDITQRKRTEETARQALAKVEASRKVLLSVVEDQKRMEQTLRRQTERLQNLHRIDQAILQVVESPEAIVHLALLHLRNLLGCQRANVGIFDLENKMARVFAAEVNGQTRFQTGKDLPEEAYGNMETLRQGQMESMEDTSRVASPSAVAPILQAEGIRSSITVPLLTEKGLIGALNIGWKNPHAITPEEREITGEVAGQIAIAMEQARLLQETNRHAAELEWRVRDRTAQLEAIIQELESFSYSVSHDLRAPLRGIDGWSLALLEDCADQLDATGRQYLNRVRAETQRMGQLIDDLLALSRVTRCEMRPSPVDLSALAQRIAVRLRESAPQRQVEFLVQSGLQTQGDPGLLEAVLTNLLDNAWKFTSRRPAARIELGRMEHEGVPVFFVRDNGAGFAMTNSQRLFAPFQRMHRAAEFPGNGIGLATVQRIIARHGGRIWAEAQVDQGATFFFTLSEKMEACRM